MSWKRKKREPYVFSELLKSQLARIPNYPLTFVEAPSGFGKTTAVREYFKGTNILNVSAPFGVIRLFLSLKLF